jgi:hypothetical protein
MFFAMSVYPQKTYLALPKKLSDALSPLPDISRDTHEMFTRYSRDVYETSIRGLSSVYPMCRYCRFAIDRQSAFTIKAIARVKQLRIIPCHARNMT